MPDASRSLNHPLQALPGAPGAARPGVERGGGACQLAALDAAAAARGATDSDGKDLLHTTNDDGATKG